MVAVNLWYHVGPANELPGRTGFAHLFEHMMFEGSRHVPGSSHFHFLEAAGASDINGTTDFDPHQLFRNPAFESAGSGAVAGVRPHGLFAGQTGPGQPVESAGRGAQRTAAERRKNAPYGVVEETMFHQIFPKEHPYYGDVIGITCRRPVRQTRRRAEFFQAVLRAKQRQPGDRRRFRSRKSPGTRGKIFRTVEARGGRSQDQDAHAGNRDRAACRGPGQRAASSRVHGLADLADFQTGRRRSGSCGNDSGRWKVQPVCTKNLCMKSKSPRTWGGESAVADSWFRL